ncbi:MAG TPA: hypothetical protein VNO32_41785 [Candidatus Acidoferrum sp.]|nr:hypothetical protein [Candidatus Acidoferrum sp.]
MTQRISFLSSIVATLALIFFCGCGQQQTNPAFSSAADRAKQLTALQEKRQNYEASLKAMSNDQLAQVLASDSAKGREPFNSPAYRETVSRGAVAASALKSQLTRPDRGSLLPLLALRQVNPELYRSLDPAFRIGVLIDALKNSKYFNTFGIPMMYWEDAAKAIIDEGEAASAPLTALLHDKRPAPVFGSEGTEINRQYHYRVCDYAWALLMEIRHQKVNMSTDPAERDRQQS